MTKDTTKRPSVSTPKKEPIFKKVLEDGTLLETIVNPDRLSTSLLVCKDGKVKKGNSYHDDRTGITFIPDYNDFVKEGSLILHSGYSDAGTVDSLLMDIKAFINKYVDVGQGFDEISARYVILTYLSDRFQKVGYLRVMGLAETGKSRFLDVMMELCYHTIHLGTDVTPANIFRALGNSGGGTLFIDEGNFSDTAAHSDYTKILNGGYERKGKVLRMNMITYKQEIFPCFGCKIAATHSPYMDMGLESRFLTRIMKVTQRKDIPLILPYEQGKWDEAEDLRRRLLDYRFSNYHKVNPMLEVTGLGNYGPRIREIASPLFQITGETLINDDVAWVLNNHQDEMKYSNQNTDEGLVAKAVLEIARNDQTPMTSKITQKTNQLSDIKLSDKKVSEILRVFGFRKTRKSSGVFVHLKSVNLNALADRYGFTRTSSEGD